MMERIQGSIGVLMGACWGIFVGMAYHNVLTWMAIGVAVGVVWDRRKRTLR